MENQVQIAKSLLTDLLMLLTWQKSMAPLYHIRVVDL